MATRFPALVVKAGGFSLARVRHVAIERTVTMFSIVVIPEARELLLEIVVKAHKYQRM